MLACKTATRPVHRPEKIESSKIDTTFLTTFTRKGTQVFLKFCMYVEKKDFEGGPRTVLHHSKNVRERRRVIEIQLLFSQSFVG